jgi:hypothetical protein
VATGPISDNEDGAIKKWNQTFKVSNIVRINPPVAERATVKTKVA